MNRRKLLKTGLTLAGSAVMVSNAKAGSFLQQGQDETSLMPVAASSVISWKCRPLASVSRI